MIPATITDPHEAVRFLLLFDVQDGNRNAIGRGNCPGSTPKPCRASSRRLPEAQDPKLLNLVHGADYDALEHKLRVRHLSCVIWASR